MPRLSQKHLAILRVQKVWRLWHVTLDYRGKAFIRLFQVIVYRGLTQY